MSELAVEVNGLGKCYSIEKAGIKGGKWRRLAHKLRFGEDESSKFWALQDVNFSVEPGQRVGVIGKNGAGKSTLLKIMSRVSYPTAGEVRIRGSLASLLEVGTGFNDNLTGHENIYLNASLYGMSRSLIAQRFDQIVAFSEIGRFIDTPIKHYSSGMRMRLAFSVAAHLEPDILLLDEVLAVGDMSFQQKCLERVDELTSAGKTLFFVSHSMDSVIRYCTRCLWIDGGKLRMDGDTREVTEAYVEEVLKVRSERTVVSIGAIDGPSTADSQHEVKAESTGSTVARETIEYRDGAELVSARIINAAGNKATLVSVAEQVGVELVYDVKGPGFYAPAIHVYCPSGTLAFAATYPSTNIADFEKGQPTRVKAVVWMPAHLFNIGTYSVSLVVFSPKEAPFKRYFSEERYLSFHVVESAIGEKSARGLMPRQFPGPVRPLLDWSVNDVER
ncbi:MULTISPECIES: ABC transporter ATP-binding protein [Rhizobium]|uniref:ATP-binding cassette domain-containing protein n=1 Tax=Rhizobium leguminosarum TaxID=384 RepID=A0A7K3VIU8_RHILE|nr:MULTISPECIES: ABC transporter ATP-binding protein [Rhizobium]MBY3122772.1 ATP-binding cassette domain-containing protein [Rhizobium laguerreae]NEK16001.1 ATP-binding cassette domain-containing protein [Rhizobium leguminosarum]TBF50698.1 ATP-binding cassette domain-containing protein [Rhizobium leguminosarum]TBF60067.1 ATP-binding cassette domain-containing protein [Rhizobium leguminosarum]TBF81106.1 ATP-binding cassette domain-containing protein [Rhizobium leguminosarum]